MAAVKRDREDMAEKDELSPGLGELITNRRVQFAVLLYVLFPVFAGFVSAMQGSGRTSSWPLGFRIAYYIPLALVMMWTLGLASHALARPARALRLPLWFLLIAGVLLAGELVKLYVQLIVPVFDKLLPLSATGGRVVEFTLLGNIQAAIPTLLTWLALNLLAWQVFGIPRFGYAAPPNRISSSWSRISQLEASGTLLPNFLMRAKLTSIAIVEAIEAQQHYIKIHTANGSRTILYRFGDAISELPTGSGVQVHRSWWVNKAHVTGFTRVGERAFVVLTSGLEVPVSRTFALQAKEQFG